MNYVIFLPFASGFLLAIGHFFMKRLAVLLAADRSLVEIILTVVSARDTYLFLSANVVASVIYIAGLRHMTLTVGFAVSFLTMVTTVLALDILVNRASLSLINIAGVGSAVVAVLLIVQR